MTIPQIWSVLLRRWPLVLGLPILVALASLGAGAAQPKSYTSSARVLVSRGIADERSTSGVTWANEDTVALDIPTIIASAAFGGDVAAALQPQGVAPGALHGSTDGKIVTVTATASQPQAAQATVQAALDLLRANGLRYWGDPTWSPEHPGVNIGALDPPSPPAPAQSTRALLLGAAMRAAAALVVALALAFGLDALRGGQPQGAA